MSSMPPKYAIKFLRWFCRRDYLEEIEGDLIQIFEHREKHSQRRAVLMFWLTVIRYFRPQFIKSFSPSSRQTSTVMLYHNITIALRNAKKYKSAFVINLVGLTTGLASVLLIWLWVQDELDVDKFHVHDQQLYRVWKNAPLADGETNTFEQTPGLMARTMAEEFPEIEYAVETMLREPGIIEYKGKRFKAQAQYAGVNFFNIFTFPLLHGSADHVLKDQRGVVISEQLALKLFGTTEHVIGKVIDWEWRVKFNGPYTVTGIFKTLPANSSMQFELLFSFDHYLDVTKDTYWGSNNAITHLMLREGTDVIGFNSKIRNFSRAKYEKFHGKDGVQWEGDIFVLPYSDNYLHGKFKNGQAVEGRIKYVKLFSTVAIFILVIACINFMNLSTARASRRMKEVGIKKTVGAARSSLVVQYITESTIIVLISLLLAIGIVWLMLPYFSLISGKELQLSFTPRQFLVLLAICAFTGLLSGSYPALYLTRFRPADILKGINKKSFGEAVVRRGLVVFQFAVTVILIVSVIIVYEQIKFIQSKNLGYDRDNIVMISNDGKLEKSLPAFLTELRRIPTIEAASSMGGDLVEMHSGGGGVDWEGKTTGIEFGGFYADYGMMELLGLQMSSGRKFSMPNGADHEKVVFNETAIRMMNLKDPVGKIVTMWGHKREIIGVMKDFHYESLYNSVGPFFIVCQERNQTTFIRLKAGSEQESVAKIHKLYNYFNPGLTFEYRFVDEDFKRIYAAENRVATLSQYFATVAILISCLGLFGLAAFTAERRTREIGIRKILGASEISIVSLLSNDFMRLIVVSIVIALPVGYYIGTQWLLGFAYRITLQWWFFASAATGAILIAGCTIIFQTLRAARVNPVKTIKSE